MKKIIKELKRLNIILSIIGMILGLLSEDLIYSMFWIVILLNELRINRLEDRLLKSIPLVDENDKLLFNLYPPNGVDKKPSEN